MATPNRVSSRQQTKMDKIINQTIHQIRRFRDILFTFNLDRVSSRSIHPRRALRGHSYPQWPHSRYQEGTETNSGKILVSSSRHLFFDHQQTKRIELSSLLPAMSPPLTCTRRRKTQTVQSTLRIPRTSRSRIHVDRFNK